MKFRGNVEASGQLIGEVVDVDITQGTDTIVEVTPGAGVTIDGVLCKDNAVTASGGFTGALTGNASTATSAAALSGGMAASSIFGFAALQILDMAGAAHALVNGAAGAGETQVLGNVFVVDANGSGGGTDPQALTLPAVVDGRILFVFNSGGENVTINDAASSTLAANKGVILMGASAAGYYVAFAVTA